MRNLKLFLLTTLIFILLMNIFSINLKADTTILEENVELNMSLSWQEVPPGKMGVFSINCKNQNNVTVSLRFEIVNRNELKQEDIWIEIKNQTLTIGINETKKVLFYVHTSDNCFWKDESNEIEVGVYLNKSGTDEILLGVLIFEQRIYGIGLFYILTWIIVFVILGVYLLVLLKSKKDPNELRKKINKMATIDLFVAGIFFITLLFTISTLSEIIGVSLIIITLFYTGIINYITPPDSKVINHKYRFMSIFILLFIDFTFFIYLALSRPW